MRKLAVLAITTGVAMVAMAGAATASIEVATYTGFVASGTDTTGVFGAPSTDLTNDSFTAVFTYDTALATTSTVPGNEQSVTGGPDTSSGGVSPILSATLTIDGMTRTFLAAQFGYADVFNYGVGLSGVETTAENNLPNVGTTYSQSYLDALIYSPGAPISLQTGYAAAGLGEGSFQLRMGDTVTGATTLVQGALDPTSVTIAGAPEAGTWALMLAGVALSGAVLRRRRVIAA